MNTIKFFETKEQYLNFRKAFSAAVNDPRAKKFRKEGYSTYTKGWMTGAHFMLLNALRGLPVTRGFSPITSELKLMNGAIANQAIDANRRHLEHVVAAAKSYVENKPADIKDSWRWKKGITQEDANNQQRDKYRATVEAFTMPFAGYISIADIARVEIKE